MNLFVALLLLWRHNIYSEAISSILLNELNLPAKLLPYVVRSNAELKRRCLNDEKCAAKLKEELDSRKCLGFEANCTFDESYSSEFLSCNGASTWSSVKTIGEQRSLFYRQADFGHVKDRMDSMATICSSTEKFGSFLECSDNLRFCRGRNIFLNFESFVVKNSARYREDLIHEEQVGGYCDIFDAKLLKSRSDHKSYLQSWASELEHFTSRPTFRVDSKHCDVIFDRRTVLIKLDAAVNMYHHFCDFINLYASQFVNGSTFDMDIDIVWWDTFSGGFVDSTFGVTWRAFSNRKPVELINLAGKRVCFRNVVFSMLARQRLGLYYNMPLVDGCSGSGLFHAFCHHILHRLGIKQMGPLKNTVRITLLIRSTSFRQIINQNELLTALQQLPNVKATMVDYNLKMPFLQQLAITHNSDIFIGMHGSGLTHALFLPDWAAVFELYNCEDEPCYRDLARLRGVKYWTWRDGSKLYPDGEGKHPTNGGAHKKFANYAFNVEEFIRLVNQMVDYVKRHPTFVREQRKLRRREAEEL